MRATGPTSRTAAVIVIVGVLLTLPCLTVGLPGDQDGPYHVDYQRSFSSQFWSGDLYPRWLVGLNAGMGTPIFYLQYPVPYFTGALLSPLLPDRPGQPKAAVELGVAAAIALIGSGLTFWIWLRRRMAAQPAALSAIVYMILPYHFTVDLYTRAAIGEHFAFVWLPLSMLFTENIVAGKRSGIPGFAISFALLLMSHLFTALLFFPVVAA